MEMTGGWNIWGKTKDKVRQFTVAKADESEAVALLKERHQEVDVISRHSMATSTIKFLQMTDGKVTEWVAIEGQISAGGTPINKPMK